MRDMGTQSYVWSSFGGLLAWLGEQHNLMMLSLAIGIVTACANLYQRCQEGKYRQRENERAEELHQLEVARQKKELEK